LLLLLLLLPLLSLGQRETHKRK